MRLYSHEVYGEHPIKNQHSILAETDEKYESLHISWF